MSKFTQQDYTIGALWRMAGKRKMQAKEIAGLLVSRAAMNRNSARQLAQHWVASRSFQDLGK